jgi:glycosyltransferase involved in cell wall biosynthesis
MRILVVSPYYKPAYSYGGPVHCLYSLSEGLAEVGAQVTVFTTNTNRPSPLKVKTHKPVRVADVSVWYFPLTLKGLTFFYSSALANAVSTRVSEFELVYVSALWGHMLIPTAKACVRAGVPYVIPVHGQLLPWAKARKRLKKSIYLKLIGKRYINRAAAIHCTDPIEAAAVMRYGFRPPIIVVPYGIHSSKFRDHRSSENLRRRFGISADADVLIFLGRLTHIKRPDIAVDVLGAVQSLNRDIHLVLIGPDEDGLLPELQAQAQGLGCHHKLHFTGLLQGEEVLPALAESDLLLMPSEIQENFGMSALEAMATGVPILVSEGIPIGKWAQIAGAGRIVPCATDAFQQAAIELFSKPEELKAMGHRGKNLAFRHFDISVVARQMLAQCQAIVTTSRPLPHSEFKRNLVA